ncbi:MAG: RNA polymerase factor sigma-54 [Mariprofundaceae bacterium]
MAGLQTNISQKLGQRLALTPQLTQSLKVLAMSAMELETYLDECLESNPLLEADMESGETEQTPADAQAKEPDEDWRDSGDNRWEEMHNSSSRDGQPDNREQQWHEEQSLSESLHEQIDRQPMSEVEHAIAHVIIDSLEEDGYYRADTQEIATEFGVKSAQIVNVLENIVQELEPAGIGARDLVECLLLQLTHNDECDALVRRILLHFSDVLFEPDDVLADKLECDLEFVLQARARLRRIDPFPGHGLHGDNNVYVTPEVIFRRTQHNDIEVEVPRNGWKGLRISKQWQGHKFSGADREFMTAASQEAKWLLYALDQRSETLMKVGSFLAKRQRAFLEHGLLGLKPLTLQDVAEEVGLHESTISRVTNGKYADTPLGLIEMRRFFSAGLPTRGGGTISVYRVQQRVRALIESEPLGKPISDQAISDRLQAEGIEIARRTVAKYREQLGLLPSSQRRRAAKALQSKKRR